MTALLRFWLTFEGRVDRRTYFRHGVMLMTLKYAGDVLLVWLFGRVLWTPADYLASVDTLLTGRLGMEFDALVALILWTLPFMWTGVTMTVRRAIDAGWSGWTAVLFFVPFVNYAVMLLMSLLPTRVQPVTNVERRDASDATPMSVAIAAGVVVGVGMVMFSAKMAPSYSVALFIGTPFMMGAMAAFVANRAWRRSRWATSGIAFATIIAAAVVALVGAAEGFICIAMTLPLAVPLVLLGAQMGYAIARFQHDSILPALVAILLLPAGASLEAAATRTSVIHEVSTAIEIDANPAQVWPHVVAFTPIPEPTELLFRLGVAYPMSARIDGSGVGAVRYCVFSTGAFVEPITAWEPGRRLAFDVRESPVPLRELTPYDGVAPPHLNGYLRSRRGEFRLIKLPHGGTRLEGTTWYELDIAPSPYWRLFSDAIIQRIHLRVLRHIKTAAERP